MKEILIELFKGYSLRFKQPLFVSFSISHIFYNWNYYLILIFSNKTIEEKIDYIFKFCDYSNFFIPVLIALIYIILFPYLNYGLNCLIEKAKINENTININALKRVMNVRKLEAQNEREISEIIAGTKELDLLKNQLDALKSENDNLSKERNELLNSRNQINKKHIELISEFEVLKNKYYDKFNQELSIIQDSDNFSVAAKNLLNKFMKYYKSKRSIEIMPGSPEIEALDELLKKNLVSRDKSLFNDNNYSITELGKLFYKIIN